MQLRHATALTSEEYVSEQAWLKARLDVCPLHPEGECGMKRHGTYVRELPQGMRVARYYCPTGGTTFSLLPDCLAARLTGALAEVEQVVEAAESSRSIEAAAERLRPDIELPGAVRWVRRRLLPIRQALLAIVTLWPGLFGAEPTLGAMRPAVGVKRGLLPWLREAAARHLRELPPPLGFGARRQLLRRRAHRRQHDRGPDPPRQWQ